MSDPPAGDRYIGARLWLMLAVYFLIAGYSSDIASLFGYAGTDGVRVISIAFFAIIILCVATERGRWPLWKRLVFVPASFVMHVVLTIPAGAMLGVLMRSPDHVRTVGEQRAVFILASLPVLLYAMHQSRLFVRSLRAGPEGSGSQSTGK